MSLSGTLPFLNPTTKEKGREGGEGEREGGREG